MPPKHVPIPSVTSSALMRDLEEMQLESLQSSQPNVIFNQASPRGDVVQGLNPVRSSSLPVEQDASMLSNYERNLQRASLAPREQTTDITAQSRVLNAFDYEDELVRFQKLPLHIQMQGRGPQCDENETAMDALVALDLARQMQQSSSRAPATKNIYKRTLWPIVCHYHEVTSSVLKIAIILAASRGCKTCAGFGHGHAKCPTSVKLKRFGKGIPMMRAVYKKVFKEFQPDGLVASDAYWPLAALMASEFSKAIQSNTYKTDVKAKSRLEQLVFYQDDSRGTFRALESYRCLICHGWGHVSTQKLRKDPQSPKEVYVCPTVTFFDERIDSDPLAMQEWIKIKRISSGKTDASAETTVYGISKETNTFYFPEANADSSQAAKAYAVYYTFFVYLLMHFAMTKQLPESVKGNVKEAKILYAYAWQIVQLAADRIHALLDKTVRFNFGDVFQTQLTSNNATIPETDKTIADIVADVITAFNSFAKNDKNLATMLKILNAINTEYLDKMLTERGQSWGKLLNFIGEQVLTGKAQRSD